MYDNNINYPQYNSFKSTLIRMLNGEDLETDIDELSEKIQAVYDSGRMSSTQYDDLMRYVQDLML